MGVILMQNHKTELQKTQSEDFPMLTSERQRTIKELAMKNGEVSISELAKRFQVSIETIRRDINLLCEKNLLKKVRGGAVPIEFTVREDAYEIRYRKNHEHKSAIGTYIAENLIEDNDTIAISSGSTMEVLASSITARNLLIVTNSINIASILQNRMRQHLLSGEVIMLGGILRADEHYTGGSIAVEMLKKFTFNKAFLGVSAISGRDVMTSNIEEGIIMSTMIDHARFCCVAADASKFDVRSTYAFADLAEIDAVVTEEDAELSEEMLATFAEAGVRHHRAPATMSEE